MVKTVVPKERIQSLGEEIANSISHGVGFLAAAVGSPILIVSAVKGGSAASIVGASIFSFSLIMLYVVSTLYHSLARNKAKRVFRILDHVIIFLLIAGTYTPFTLGVLRGAMGWTLFGLVWGLAVVGVVFQCLGGIRHKKLSMILYLAMGWLVIVAIKPLVLNTPLWGLFWLVAGGVAYSAGVGFYIAKKLPYGHFVWHLFVLMGSSFHFAAVLICT
jgi:hemolysin III